MNIRNVNTDSLIEAVIRTPDGQVEYDGDSRHRRGPRHGGADPAQLHGRHRLQDGSAVPYRSAQGDRRGRGGELCGRGHAHGADNGREHGHRGRREQGRAGRRPGVAGAAGGRPGGGRREDGIGRRPRQGDSQVRHTLAAPAWRGASLPATSCPRTATPPTRCPAPSASGAARWCPARWPTASPRSRADVLRAGGDRAPQRLHHRGVRAERDRGRLRPGKSRRGAYRAGSFSQGQIYVPGQGVESTHVERHSLGLLRKVLWNH